MFLHCRQSLMTKSKMRWIIYEITCELPAITGRYIGSNRSTIARRFYWHQAESKQSRNTGKMYNLMRRWGIDHFHIAALKIIDSENHKQLLQQEYKIIAGYPASELGNRQTSLHPAAASAAWTGKHHTPAAKRAIGKASASRQKIRHQTITIARVDFDPTNWTDKSARAWLQRADLHPTSLIKSADRLRYEIPPTLVFTSKQLERGVTLGLGRQ